RRPDRDLADDPVRVRVDDADGVRCEGGEAGGSAVAGQLDDGDADRGCDEDEGAGSDQEAASAAGRLARRPPRRRPEALVVAEDVSLELLKSRTGLESELGGECPSRGPV